jgi:transcriptional regulator with XRE-family HTH domain
MQRHANIQCKLARVAAGLSLQALALKTGGISASFLCRMETGGCARTTIQIRQRIAKALETPTELLFPEVSDEN